MKKVTISILMISWVVGLYFFFEAKSKFSLTPALASQLSDDFPIKSSIEFENGLHNLVLFIHPQCTCSVATVENLKDLITQNEVIQKNVKIHIVIFDPAKTNDHWLKSDVVDKLKELSRNFPLDFVYDKTLSEFKSFDAQTSGQAFLFSPSKKLLFSGGLTDERAHAGPARGAEAILEIVNKESRLPSSVAKTPVFGCETQERELKSKNINN